MLILDAEVAGTVELAAVVSSRLTRTCDTDARVVVGTRVEVVGSIRTMVIALPDFLADPDPFLEAEATVVAGEREASVELLASGRVVVDSASGSMRVVGAFREALSPDGLSRGSEEPVKRTISQTTNKNRNPARVAIGTSQRVGSRRT